MLVVAQSFRDRAAVNRGVAAVLAPTASCRELGDGRQRSQLSRGRGVPSSLLAQYPGAHPRLKKPAPDAGNLPVLRESAS